MLILTEKMKHKSGVPIISVQAEYCTDKGNARSSNQDNLFFNGSLLNKDTAFDSDLRIFNRFPMLFAVCDGMGGEKHGDEASYIAVKLLKKYRIKRYDNAEYVLNTFVDHANREIINLGRAGSTLVALILSDNNATVAHLGDSRAYLFRDGILTLLTEDHTQKRMDGQEQRSSILTRHLGMSMDDLVMTPTYYNMKLLRGDIFLLCSDGLTDFAEKTDITDLLNEVKHPAHSLVEAAIRNGSMDNTTAIVLKIT